MLAVAGNPTYHSLSPELFRSAGQIYTRISVESVNELKQIIDDHNIKGLNITSPFKNRFVTYLSEKDEIVTQTESVNTVVFENNRAIGYNTDYYAVYNFLKKYNNCNLLLLGAGSVTQTILYACKELNIKAAVYNRTISKVKKLENKYRIQIVTENSLADAIRQSDIIFNLSPALNDDIINILNKNIRKEHIIADAIYHNSPLNTLDINVQFSGIDWLRMQGIRSYQHFTNDETLKEFENVYRKKPENFILTGFMGAGKTTIGKLLANKLGYDFIDTDSMIEKKCNLSIQEIFSKYDESYFRKLETEAINSINVRNCVIATGGGALMNNETKLHALGEIIYLYSDINSLIERVKHSDRPLLNNNNVSNLFNQRKNLYFRNSDLTIFSKNDVNYVAERLYKEINNAFFS